MTAGRSLSQETGSFGIAGSCTPPYNGDRGNDAGGGTPTPSFGLQQIRTDDTVCLSFI